MFRYLGFAWDPASARCKDAADLLSRRTATPSWSQVLDRKGLRVFCADSRSGSLEPHVLADSAGVILGTLFERNADIEDHSPARRATLDPVRCKLISDSGGRWLIDNCWGNYVAIVDGAGGRTLIIKDPTGSLPCFMAAFEGVTVLFSCISDCLSIGLPPFTINRAYLRARILSGGGDLDQSPLNEVTQVHRGEYVELDVKSRRSVAARDFYWNPLTFHRSNGAIEDVGLAARAIRATVRSCTHTWAGCHDSLLLRLSGGLDSSIIAGCLKDAPTQPRMVCYTYFNPRGRSDERPWARLAAQHAAIERLEYPVTPADIDLRSMLAMERSVEPLAAMGYVQRVTIERQLATTREATAVFTGDGGDSGFASDSIGYALPEYLRRHGLRPGAFRLASWVALYTEQSTWSVLLRAMRLWIFDAQTSNQRSALLMGSRLVRPEIRERLCADERYPHPWFNDRKRIPWATIRRVGTLVCAPDLYSGASSRGSAPEVISPLYSQPVIETLLRIPVYTHFAGGRDRGLARQAFEREVPRAILQRLWKDRAPGFYDELVQRNRELLRQIFLEGVLVAEGLLDRAAIEAALSTGPSKSAVLPGELFKHLDVEIWARQWTLRT